MNQMETHQILMARARAIHYFGSKDYILMLKAAKDYLDREHIPIPATGIESMPIFWECINNLMTTVVE